MLSRTFPRVLRNTTRCPSTLFQCQNPLFHPSSSHFRLTWPRQQRPISTASRRERAMMVLRENPFTVSLACFLSVTNPPHKVLTNVIPASSLVLAPSFIQITSIPSLSKLSKHSLNRSPSSSVEPFGSPMSNLTLRRPWNIINKL